jgi:hypothetical protein
MLDFRMLYFNYNRRLTTTYIIDPFIIPEDSQGLSNRFVDAGDINFNRMFNLLEVDTGHFARLEGHNDDLSYFAFSSPVRLSTSGPNPLIETKEKRAIEEGESPNARLFNSPIAREEVANGLFGSHINRRLRRGIYSSPI